MAFAKEKGTIALIAPSRMHFRVESYGNGLDGFALELLYMKWKGVALRGLDVFPA